MNCLDCNRDAGGFSAWSRHECRTVFIVRTCPGCDRPLCRVCADKDPVMSELCAECSSKVLKTEKQHAESI